MRQGTNAEGKGHGIAHLRTLLPFVGKHWLALAVGFAFMLVQNYGAVRVPGYFQKILDEITGANRTGQIQGLLVTACIYAASPWRPCTSCAG